MNGDGFSDVIIGADAYDNGESDEGRACVYRGSAAGLAAAPAWTGESNQFGAQFGFSVASAGDVNADGFSDVVVGAVFYDNDQVDEDGAFVYHGSPAGLAATPAVIVDQDQDNAWFGYAVANLGRERRWFLRRPDRRPLLRLARAPRERVGLRLSRQRPRPLQRGRELQRRP